MTEPRIVERAEQPYVGITGSVTITSIGDVADRIPDVFGWLAERGIEPVGAPFFRYTILDMDGEFDVEAGVPIAAPTEGSGDVRTGTLPAGRYLTVTHIGHPDGLAEATMELLDWAAQEGLEWDVTDTGAGQKWGCRLEIYNTNPAEEPDASKWETTLAFRLAD
jgi:effector-binding domain-containing protein